MPRGEISGELDVHCCCAMHTTCTRCPVNSSVMGGSFLQGGISGRRKEGGMWMWAGGLFRQEEGGVWVPPT